MAACVACRTPADPARPYCPAHRRAVPVALRRAIRRAYARRRWGRYRSAYQKAAEALTGPTPTGE